MSLVGPQHIVNMMKGNLSNAFICKDEGWMKEFVGSRINSMRDANGIISVKITQPVIVQKAGG